MIKVGAASETEITYMKHKMEDALAATKAAVEEGIVAGGGTALAKTATKITIDAEKAKDHEYKAGYETLLKALNEPLKQIVANAGERDAAVVLNAIVESKKENYGYNAAENRFEEDMVKSGIIDPLKVTRTALENAVSVAAMLLTTEVVVTDKPEKKDDAGGAGGGMMPGMGGMGGMV